MLDDQAGDAEQVAQVGDRGALADLVLVGLGRIVRRGAGESVASSSFRFGVMWRRSGELERLADSLGGDRVATGDLAQLVEQVADPA